MFIYIRHGVNASEWPRWAWMWTLATGIYALCKPLTWSTTSAHRTAAWKHVAYLLAWPGMDAAAFLEKKPRTVCCSHQEWIRAASHLVLGAVVVFVAARQFPAEHRYIVGWIGMVGMVLLLHFGVFHLTSCMWRGMEVEARPLMNRPLYATGLGEFWSRRWNTAFRDLTHRYLFKPLTARFGSRAGILAGFAVSGLVHDLVISLPAGGGYGGPTLFFTIQGVAVACERSEFGWRVGLGRGAIGRSFAFASLITPLPLLFHQSAFMTISRLIFFAGIGQLGVLFASALVPLRLNWRQALRPLPLLHRQMFWVYGGYVALSIVAFDVLSIVNAEDLAGDSARSWPLRVYSRVLGRPTDPARRFRRQAVLEPLVDPRWLLAPHRNVRRVRADLRMGGGSITISRSSSDARRSLAIAGIAGFSTAIGVHPAIGYLSVTRLTTDD